MRVTTKRDLPHWEVFCPTTNCVYNEERLCDDPQCNKYNSDACCHHWTNSALLDHLRAFNKDLKSTANSIGRAKELAEYAETREGMKEIVDILVGAGITRQYLQRGVERKRIPTSILTAFIDRTEAPRRRIRVREI